MVVEKNQKRCYKMSDIDGKTLDEAFTILESAAEGMGPWEDIRITLYGEPEFGYELELSSQVPMTVEEIIEKAHQVKKADRKARKQKEELFAKLAEELGIDVS